ncbi:MAG: DeoR/GlpR family DNA-binding transcription regulator [Christensenellales bacterium]|jgi:DeoR/GlpR family transcriptional regulator of sugar metabolism
MNRRDEMGEREVRILEMLTAEGRAEVAELARRLGVSQVTVRKDLDALDRRGLIVRAHGSARLRSAEDIAGRVAHHYEAKLRIARAAARLVAPGETVMIESGSCCALLAEALVSSEREISIITNSAYIAGRVRAFPGARVILLGGAYQNNAQVTVGPILAQAAQNFMVDNLFIGTDGYAAGSGFTNSDHMRAQAVRDMARQAAGVVVLTESEKFARSGVVPLRIDERVRAVVTDEGIPEGARESLQARGVEVITP